MKIKNEISKVEKLKSENQKNYKSKNVRKNSKCQIFPTLRIFKLRNEKIIVPRLSVRFPIQKIFISVTDKRTEGQRQGQKDRDTDPFRRGAPRLKKSMDC